MTTMFLRLPSSTVVPVLLGACRTVSLASTKLPEAGAGKVAAPGSSLVALGFPSEMIILLLDQARHGVVGGCVYRIIADDAAHRVWCLGVWEECWSVLQQITARIRAESCSEMA